MSSAVSSVESWLSAIVEFTVTFLGVAVVAYPVLAFVESVLVGGAARGAVGFLAFSLAFGATYVFMTGSWSVWRYARYLVVAALVAAGWWALFAVVGVDLPGEGAFGSQSLERTAWLVGLAAAGVVHGASRIESELSSPS